jgi:hypothetical protein
MMLTYASHLHPHAGPAMLVHQLHIEGLLTMVQGGASHYQ